jgi:hypothetical protein
MNRPIVALGAALSLCLFVAGAEAAELCKAQEGQRRSNEEVKAMLESQGYEVRSVGEEDGCIEAKGFDKNNNRVEIYVHPVSGDIVKVKG